MSIWNKVLIGFIFVASLAFAYLAMSALKTHESWKVLADEYVEGAGVGRPGILWYQDKNKSTQNLIAGLELEVRKLLANRDRIWSDCQPQVDPQTARTGRVSVTADVAGISPRAVLQVFEANTFQDGGRYLGEFKIAADQGGMGQLTMEPSTQMSARELQRLAASASNRVPWVLYETMPRDTHNAFNHLTPEEIEQLMPAEDVAEYLNDGKLLGPEEVAAAGLTGTLVAVDPSADAAQSANGPMGRLVCVDQDGKTLYCSSVDENGRLIYEDEAGQFVYAATLQENADPNSRASLTVIYQDQEGRELPDVRIETKEVVEGKGKYARPLNDYFVLVGECRRQHAELVEEIVLAKEDRDMTQVALAKDKEYIAYRRRERDALAVEASETETQRDLIHAVMTKLDEETKACQDTIERLIRENQTAAQRLDEIQQAAKQAIDARTASLGP